jgi:hypothetical protein
MSFRAVLAVSLDRATTRGALGSQLKGQGKNLTSSIAREAGIEKLWCDGGRLERSETALGTGIRLIQWPSGASFGRSTWSTLLE